MAKKKKEKAVKVFKKLRVLKPLLYTVIAAVVLGVLLVGAGIAYTYFVGSAESAGNQDEAVLTGQVYNEPSFEAEEPAPDANVGVSVQMITTPVVPGANATFEVRTLRGAECDITVEYDEVKSEDSGLITKTADRFGMASWTWTVEETVPEGEWPVEVTCSWYEQSGMVRHNLEVSYSQAEQ